MSPSSFQAKQRRGLRFLSALFAIAQTVAPLMAQAKTASPGGITTGGTNRLVCASNGRTYASKDVAVAQGYTIANLHGPCPGDPLSSLLAHAIDSEQSPTTLTSGLVNKFASEGLGCVAKVRLFQDNTDTAEAHRKRDLEEALVFAQAALVARNLKKRGTSTSTNEGKTPAPATSSASAADSPASTRAASPAAAAAATTAASTSSSPLSPSPSSSSSPRHSFLRVTRDGHVYSSEHRPVNPLLHSPGWAATTTATLLPPAADSMSPSFPPTPATASSSEQAPLLSAADRNTSVATPLQAPTALTAFETSSSSPTSPKASSSSKQQNSKGTDRRPHHSRRHHRRHLKAIFGGDDRVLCPTTGIPFSAVGQVDITSSAGRFICSGTMVSADVFLTAAHCVFSRSMGAFFQSLDFAPGRTSDPYGQPYSPWGAIPWEHFSLYSGYTQTADGSIDPNTLDIAVVKLSQPVGQSSGWLGLGQCLQQPETLGLTTAGYPDDLPWGTCITCQCQVTISDCNDPYLIHYCDTVEGQSGSGMWDDSVRLRAVHNLQWTGSDGVAVYNSAVALTPEHYVDVMGWIGAEDGSQQDGGGLSASNLMGSAPSSGRGVQPPNATNGIPASSAQGAVSATAPINVMPVPVTEYQFTPGGAAASSSPSPPPIYPPAPAVRRLKRNRTA